MPRIEYNKLVRDKIPEIIVKDGCTPKVKILSQEDFEKALREKFVEESKELELSKTKEDTIKELSDLEELIRSLTKLVGSSFDEVESVRLKRLTDRGGFEKKLFLEYVDEPDKT